MKSKETQQLYRKQTPKNYRNSFEAWQEAAAAIPLFQQGNFCCGRVRYCCRSNGRAHMHDTRHTCVVCWTATEQLVSSDWYCFNIWFGSSTVCEAISRVSNLILELYSHNIWQGVNPQLQRLPAACHTNTVINVLSTGKRRPSGI